MHFGSRFQHDEADPYWSPLRKVGPTTYTAQMNPPHDCCWKGVEQLTLEYIAAGELKATSKLIQRYRAPDARDVCFKKIAEGITGTLIKVPQMPQD
jgi:hypothetical protein